MVITFKRPLIMTEKYLDIYRDQKKVGKMRYWRRPPRERSTSNPKYDVNIEIVGSDQTYEIIQQSFTIRDGGQWHIIKNGNFIATMSSGKEVIEKDQVEIQLDDETTLAIEATIKFKSEGSITLNGEQIGKTTVNGLLFNSYYEVDIWDSRMTMDPNLLAGVVYTFWSTSNQR